MSYSFSSSRNGSSRTRYRSNNRPSQNRRSNRRTGQRINPERFVKVAKPATVEVYEPTHQFKDFALNDTLQANLTAKGFVVPSPIQDQAIPAALKGQDVIGIASTGTGKTAAFALPMLNRLMANKQASALIVAPTRELAQQIEQECRTLGRNSGLHGALLIGGASIGHQLRDLRHNPRVIIGTPGRIKDHIQRGTLQLGTCNIVVLDEVDRMLDMGFVDDVTEILTNVSDSPQSLFFSATMDERVQRLIRNFTSDPVTISIRPSATSENVHQNVVKYRGNIEKMDKLHDLLINPDVDKVIIFDETQRNVERLNNELYERGFATEAIHGGKTQGHRQRALNRFRKDQVNILVATDVAARGIDVANVSHVINYSAPEAYEDYVHRIGRAGRAGRTGYALTFIPA